MAKQHGSPEEVGFGRTKIWVFLPVLESAVMVGMLSATASLGWLYLWDVEDSINHIDPFIYADDVNIQVSYLNCLV